MAETLAAWRTDDFRYDNLAPAAERQAQRKELAAWIKEQFARIQAGKEPQMDIKKGMIEPGRWQIDAP